MVGDLGCWHISYCFSYCLHVNLDKDFEKKTGLLWTDHNNSGKLSHILIILMNAFQESVISLVKASYA